MTDRYMTKDELARMLRCTRRALEGGIAAGRIPDGFHAGGRRKLFDRERIERWIAEGCPAVGKADMDAAGPKEARHGRWDESGTQQPQAAN